MSRVLLALLLLTVAPVQATTYTVMSNASSGPDTLRQALADADANPGPDTIVFDSSLIGATITVVPTLAVQSGEVTVSGALRNVTITGNSQVTIFTVSPGATLNLFNLNLTNGKDVARSGAITNEGTVSLTGCGLYNNIGSFGGAINSSGTLTLNKCTLSGNTGDYGGAISATGPVTLVDCTVSQNTAANDGGGVRLASGTLTLTNCIVAQNTASSGADVHFATATLVRSGLNIIRSAVGTGSQSGPAALDVDPLLAPLGNYGGDTKSRPPLPGSPAIDPVGGATSSALGSDQRGFLRVVDAGTQAGAIVDIGAVEVATVVTTAFDAGNGSLRQLILGAAPGQTLTFNPSLNGATVSTGDEMVISRDLIIDASNLSKGFSLSGGAINRLLSIDTGRTVSVTGLKFINGRSQGATDSGAGGAIANRGTLTLTNCEFTGNQATQVGVGRGGAIYNYFGALLVKNCTFSGNSATLGGGAIYTRTDLAGITAKFQQCTITGNTTAGNGGGIYNFDGRTEITDCTITNNTAPTNQGSGVASYGNDNGNLRTETSCRNSIIAGNQSTDVDYVVLSNNSFLSVHTNLIGTGNATPAFTQTGDVTGVTDPKLATLADYGGPTLTRPPLPDSQAIDAGDAPLFSVDQRGATRIIDGDDDAGAVVDIGATEADTLANNAPGTIAFSTPEYFLAENNGTQVIELVRTGGLRGVITLDVTPTLLTAQSGDFAPSGVQTVTFAHGQSAASVEITPVQDLALREPHESITLTAGTPSGGATLGAQTTTKIYLLDGYDVTKPVVSFTSPADLSVVLEASNPTGNITVNGTARDDKGVDEVRVGLNGAAAASVPVTRANDLKTAIWTEQFTLVPGMNSLLATAYDFNGGISTTVLRRIDYQVTRPLSTVVSGPANSGSIPTAFTGTTDRLAGRFYTIKAVPRAGYVFDGWTANDFTGTGVTDAAKELPSLTFKMQEGLVLTANFRLNPFVPAIAGAYNGLVTVHPSSAVAAGNVTTGLVTASVTGTGSFSGRLRIDGSVLKFSGVFTNDGNSRFGKTRTNTVALKRTGRPDVNLRLDLDMGGANKKLTGQVSQTITGVGQAVSLIDADRAEFSRTVPLLSPYVGTVSQRYNLITTPEPVANPANYPQGYSVASFTVFPTGKVTWTGRLADDTKISGSSALSKDRRFPLFVSLYGAKGCFASAVTLDVAPSGSDLTSTDRFWFRPAIAGSQWYPAGWSDGIVFGLTGAKYANDPSKPAASVAHWLAWDKGLLSVELKQSVTPTSGDLITKADPLDTSFSVSFKRSTGELSGSFTHPADGKATGYRATTLQKGSGAGTFGYFRTVSPKVVDGKGQAGSARLYPQ